MIPKQQLPHLTQAILYPPPPPKEKQGKSLQHRELPGCRANPYQVLALSVLHLVLVSHFVISAKQL